MHRDIVICIGPGLFHWTLFGRYTTDLLVGQNGGNRASQESHSLSLFLGLSPRSLASRHHLIQFYSLSRLALLGSTTVRRRSLRFPQRLGQSSPSNEHTHALPFGHASSIPDRDDIHRDLESDLTLHGQATRDVKHYNKRNNPVEGRCNWKI
jgi:hypothetical protein